MIYYYNTRNTTDQEHKNYYKTINCCSLEEQQLKETRHTKQRQGYIVSYSPSNRLQLDIFFFKKIKVTIKSMVIYYVSYIYIIVKYGHIKLSLNHEVMLHQL